VSLEATASVRVSAARSGGASGEEISEVSDRLEGRDGEGALVAVGGVDLLGAVGVETLGRRNE
jgi:hypothetical protein